MTSSKDQAINGDDDEQVNKWRPVDQQRKTPKCVFNVWIIIITTIYAVIKADDYDDDNSAVLYQKLATLMIIGASTHPQDDSNQLHCSNEKGSLAPVFWPD